MPDKTTLNCWIRKNKTVLDRGEPLLWFGMHVGSVPIGTLLQSYVRVLYRLRYENQLVYC